MAIPEPGCCDGPNELLRKILLGLPDIAAGGSGGSPVEVQDEGVTLTAAVSSINFTGTCVTATTVGNDVTVDIDCSGDVFGPGSSGDGNIAVFNGLTGKIIADSGINISDIVTNDDLQSGAEPIGAGVTVVPVVFPTPFSAPPHVVISTSRPTADSSIGSNVMSDTITALGFSARMASATPNANYILQWMAHL